MPQPLPITAWRHQRSAGLSNSSMRGSLQYILQVPHYLQGATSENAEGFNCPSGDADSVSVGSTPVKNFRPAERRRAPPRGCRSVRLQPRARGALGLSDLRFRHLLRDLAAQPDCLRIALQRGQVEPLVRSDEVDRNV